MVDSKSAAGSEAPFAILDMMSATVLLTDTSGRVLWGNSASEVLLGCSRRTFVGTDFRDRLAECDEWYAHLASGRPWSPPACLGVCSGRIPALSLTTSAFRPC